MNCTDCRCTSEAINRAQGCPMKVIETVSADLYDAHQEDCEPLTDSEKLFLWPALIVCFCIAMAFLTWAWKAFA